MSSTQTEGHRTQKDFLWVVLFLIIFIILIKPAIIPIHVLKSQLLLQSSPLSRLNNKQGHRKKKDMFKEPSTHSNTE